LREAAAQLRDRMSQAVARPMQPRRGMRNSSPMLIVLGGALATAAPACEGHDSAGAPPTARELLAEPLRLDVTPDDSAVALAAHVDQGGQVDEARLALAIDRGWFDLAARGSQLELDGLEVRLAPIDLGSVMPAGIRLVDIRVHLARPALSRDAVWQPDERACAATVSAALELDWSLEIAGEAYPLAPQALGHLTLDLSVTGGGDTLGATVLADVPGVRWSLADIVFRGELTLAVCAVW
jgi:hypothetical protein